MENISGIVLVTKKCNFNCRYCYVDKAKDEIINKEYIDTFIKGIKYNNMLKHICFFGGEPMLAKNLLLDVMRENPDFNFTIITNGSYKFETYDKIPQNLTHMIFSLEIDEYAFEHYRSQGKKSFYDVYNSLLETKKKINNTTVNISLNKYVIEHPEILIEFSEKLKKEHINFCLYFLKGYDEFDKYQLYDFLMYLKSNSRYLYEEIIYLKDNIFDFFSYACTYSNSLTLDTDGNLITCSREDKKICNVQDFDDYENFFNIINNENKREFFDKCKTCPVSYSYCNVSCAANLKNNLISESACECQRLLFALHLEEKNLLEDVKQ